MKVSDHSPSNSEQITALLPSNPNSSSTHAAIFSKQNMLTSVRRSDNCLLGCIFIINLLGTISCGGYAIANTFSLLEVEKDFKSALATGIVGLAFFFSGIITIRLMKRDKGILKTCVKIGKNDFVAKKHWDNAKDRSYNLQMSLLKKMNQLISRRDPNHRSLDLIGINEIETAWPLILDIIPKNTGSRSPSSSTNSLNHTTFTDFKKQSDSLPSTSTPTQYRSLKSYESSVSQKIIPGDTFYKTATSIISSLNLFLDPKKCSDVQLKDLRKRCEKAWSKLDPKTSSLYYLFQALDKCIEQIAQRLSFSKDVSLENYTQIIP